LHQKRGEERFQNIKKIDDEGMMMKKKLPNHHKMLAHRRVDTDKKTAGAKGRDEKAKARATR